MFAGFVEVVQHQALLLGRKAVEGAGGAHAADDLGQFLGQAHGVQALFQQLFGAGLQTAGQQGVADQVEEFFGVALGGAVDQAQEDLQALPGAGNPADQGQGQVEEGIFLVLGVVDGVQLEDRLDAVVGVEFLGQQWQAAALDGLDQFGLGLWVVVVIQVFDHDVFLSLENWSADAE